MIGSASRAARSNRFLCRVLLLPLLLLLHVAAALAQPLEEPLAPLSFLVGRWTGEGWMTVGGARREVVIDEEFVPRLEGRALLAEPVYRARRPDGSAGEPLRRAIAMFLRDPDGGGIQLRTFFPSGASDQFRVAAKANRLKWDLPSETEPGRWKMELEADGTIHETGEFRRSGRWERVFEIRLRRAGSGGSDGAGP